MFASCEVILGGVDEGQSEIEHQVDEERSDAFSQEHLTDGWRETGREDELSAFEYFYDKQCSL